MYVSSSACHSSWFPNISIFLAYFQTPKSNSTRPEKRMHATSTTKGFFLQICFFSFGSISSLAVSFSFSLSSLLFILYFYISFLMVLSISSLVVPFSFYLSFSFSLCYHLFILYLCISFAPLLMNMI